MEPLARIPDGVADDQAAALPIPATTALRTVELLEVTAGQHVVVMGATGGVGGYAVQIARSRGAHVIATVRRRRRRGRRAVWGPRRSTTARPKVARLLAAAADRGVRVRLCFGDPAGEAVAIRDREEGLGDTLAAKIRSALTYYRDIAAAGDDATPGCTPPRLYATACSGMTTRSSLNPHA